MHKYLDAVEAAAFKALSNPKDVLPLDGDFKTIIEELSKYDWSYGYSDDGDVWRNGERRRVSLAQRIDAWPVEVERKYLLEVFSNPRELNARVQRDFVSVYGGSLVKGRVAMAMNGVDDELFDHLVELRNELRDLVAAVPQPDDSYHSSVGYFLSNSKTNYALMRKFAVDTGDKRFYGIILPEETRTAIVAVIKFMETKYWKLKETGYSALYEQSLHGGWVPVMPRVSVVPFEGYSRDLPEGVKAKILFVAGQEYSYVV